MRPSLRVLAAALFLSSAAEAQQEPPRRLDFATDTATQEPRRTTERSVGNRFVRDQALLGAFVYAPAFAAAVGSDGLTGTAAYLVVAGGTFFAATELTRRMEITPARQILARGLPLRGAGTLGILAQAAELEGPQTGAMIFLGGVGGLASGLAMGKGLSEGEAAATIFGHDLGFISGMAIDAMLTGGTAEDLLDVRGNAERVAVWTGSGIAGLLLGRRYAANARHNVTAGDVQAMWLGTSIGMLGATALIVESEPDVRTTAGALLAGALTGAFLSERGLVRRYDHTRGEGNILSLGATAGAVMGVGLGVLIGGELERGTALTFGLATAGAAGGLALTERYLQPAGDAGRSRDTGGADAAGAGRLSFDPMAAVSAAMRRPGRHAILSLTF